MSRSALTMRTAIVLILGLSFSGTCALAADAPAGGYQNQVLGPGPGAMPGAPAVAPSTPAAPTTLPAATTSPTEAAKDGNDLNPADILSAISSAAGGAGGEESKPLDSLNTGEDNDPLITDPDASQYLSGADDRRACSSGGQSMWKSTLSVVNDQVIPAGRGYDMGAPGTPRLTGSGKSVQFGPGQASHCVSATATAFKKYIADLVASGQLTLNSAQIEFLNSQGVQQAFYGTTYSYAYLNQRLGGQSMWSKQSSVVNVLAKAKPGDILKFDRSNGTGHSTVFQEMRGDKVCYWSSNKRTRGAGLQCESISRLTNVVVSRLPSAKDLPSAIDAMIAKGGLTGAYRPDPSKMAWSPSLSCPDEGGSDTMDPNRPEAPAVPEEAG